MEDFGGFWRILEDFGGFWRIIRRNLEDPCDRCPLFSFSPFKCRVDCVSFVEIGNDIVCSVAELHRAIADGAVIGFGDLFLEFSARTTSA